MESLLAQLYREDIRLGERRRALGREKKAEILLEKYDAFREGLDSNRVKTFDELKDAELELLDMDTQWEFVNGFRLGARMMMEILAE